MKPGQLKRFVSQVLTAKGAVIEEIGSQLLKVSPAASEAECLGTQPFVLAFSPRGLEENAEAELAVVGNPVFDRILELAMRSGQLGQRFLPAPRRRKKLPAAPALTDGVGRRLIASDPVAVYSPVYFVCFKLEYSMEETPDEVEILAIDGSTRDPLAQVPDLVDFWEELEIEPAPERVVEAAFPLSPDVVDAALAALDRRMRKRVAKVRRVSEVHLTKETTSVQGYYEQLIRETRNAGRRWSSTADERTEKIRVLQLDWKRRIEEAQQFWEPRIEVQVTAVGAVGRPRLRVEYRLPEQKRGGPARTAYFDEVEELWLLGLPGAQPGSLTRYAPAR